MDTKEKVKERQLTILAGLINWEMLCARLYAAYAEIFTDSRAFWSELSSDEKQHAKMLGTLTRYVKDGHVFWNLGYFDEKGLAPMIDLVTTAITDAAAEGYSETEALQTACHVESSIVESKIYDQLKSDAPGFLELSRSLAAEEEAHLERLRERYHDHLL